MSSRSHTGGLKGGVWLPFLSLVGGAPLSMSTVQTVTQAHLGPFTAGADQPHRPAWQQESVAFLLFSTTGTRIPILLVCSPARLRVAVPGWNFSRLAYFGAHAAYAPGISCDIPLDQFLFRPPQRTALWGAVEAPLSSTSQTLSTLCQRRIPLGPGRHRVNVAWLWLTAWGLPPWPASGTRPYC